MKTFKSFLFACALCCIVLPGVASVIQHRVDDVRFINADMSQPRILKNCKTKPNIHRSVCPASPRGTSPDLSGRRGLEKDQINKNPDTELLLVSPF